MVAEYIENMGNIFQKALLIFYSTKEVYSNFSHDQLLDMEGLLTDSVKKIKLNSFTTAAGENFDKYRVLYLKLALSKLKQINN